MGSFDGTKINKISFPNSLEFITDSFQYCEELKEISLNKKIKSIYNSFINCDLRKVMIPNSTRMIDNSFRDNPNLEDVNIEVKNYLLVLAYLNKYYKDLVKQDYKDLMIKGYNFPFEGTKLYSLIEEEVNKYQEPNIPRNKNLKVYKLKERIIL